MFRFTPVTIPRNIFVIGAGGTGSRLLPLLAQFMRTITIGKSPTGWVENPTIWLVDADAVEQKNLARQNFVQQDVGKPKATVLADRYSRAYGVNIIPILKMIGPSASDAREFVNEVSEAYKALDLGSANTGVASVIKGSMVIMCVDSSKARRSILNTFMSQSPTNSIFNPNSVPFFIDAGNEDNFGQVSFFNGCVLTGANEYKGLPVSLKVPKLVPAVVDVNFIPMDFKYYKDLKDTESSASCADLNQTLAINAIMATTIMGIVQNYYYRKPMTYNLVRMSLEGGSMTEYNSFRNWESRALPVTITEANHEVYIKEKDGTSTYLNFPSKLGFNYLTNIARLLNDKIQADEVEKLEAQEKLELDSISVKLVPVAKEEELESA